MFDTDGIGRFPVSLDGHIQISIGELMGRINNNHINRHSVVIDFWA